METRDIEIAVQNVLDRQRLGLADKQDMSGINQMIRISVVLILANLIKTQKPEQDFAVCKLEATDQMIAAVNTDWQV